MNLIKQFASQVDHYSWWQGDEPVVVAVSTGVDSMVLLDLLQHLRYRRPRIIVAHVNHHLRAASQTEVHYLTRYCRAHHLQLQTADWVDHPQRGIEEAGRHFRYQFFEKVMAHYNARILLTAHHQNDQAETLLMKLIRGNALPALTGIALNRSFYHGQLVRPLLNFPKRALYDYAVNHHLKWYEDATNHENTVFRNRVRNQILPQMTRDNPQLIQHLADTTNQIQQLLVANHDLIQPLIDKMKTAQPNQWAIDVLLKQSLAVQKSVLALMVTHLDEALILSTAVISEAVQMINNDDKPNAELSLGNGYLMVKSYRSLTIKKLTDFHRNDASNPHFMVILNRWIRVGKQRLGVFDHLPLDSQLAAVPLWIADEQLPLVMRRWRPGDRLPLKNGGHKKISRILIDRKVKTEDRDTAMVLVDQNDVVLSLVGYQNGYFDPLNKQKYWISSELEGEIIKHVRNNE